jgi:PAS domain S-box-containing protein
MILPNKNSIALRLLLIVLGLYSVVAFIVTASHVAVEYHQQQQNIDEDLRGTQQAFRAGMAQALWNLDNKVIRKIIRGMLSLPSVIGVCIVDPEGNLLAIADIYPEENSTKSTHIDLNLRGLPPDTRNAYPDLDKKRNSLLNHTFELKHNNDGTEVALGSMTIYSSSAIILSRMKLQIFLLLVNVVITFITFCLALLWAFHRYLHKPLAELTQATEKITLHNLHSAQVSPKAPEGSEIHLLAESFNSMVKELDRAMAEQRLAESALLRNQENLRITLDSIGDAVIATDASGKITRMNPVAEKLTGWTSQAAFDRPLPEVFNIIHKVSRQTAENPVEKVLETRNVVGLADHTVLVSKDGSEYLIADSGAPIRDKHGTVVGVVLVFRDVTEEYALRERLNQSQRMEAIGQLAGGVAHDFNNMLGGIMGAAEILGTELSDTPTAKEFHTLLLESTQRAADLTSKLLAFARRKQLGSTITDIHQIIKDAVALLKRSLGPHINLLTSLEAENSSVIGDQTQLANVIMNLAINAAHAMPDGGTVSISSDTVELDSIYCDNSAFDIAPGWFIKIEVLDSGHGIPPEDLPRIFEPFFTTKSQGKGTGLGLAAVYGTIQQHHGSISAYSEIDKGTRFSIYLPLTEKTAKPRESESETIHGLGTILVVDDEPAMRTIYKSTLETLGYTVDIAEDGEEALKLFKADPGKYDLVILDMIMPGMSGKSCFEKMRQIAPNTRAILSSGFSPDEDLKEMLKQGLLGFIKKPFKKQELSQVVHEAMQTPHE